ncbi:2'-5' RNA ligase family protein [Marinobacterium weihaiense]|uniref:2'-5' RNA ligase family protein n=1 Tax=Marinobacterium weihaiense TaxID=2851016 RepID=A0ABS6MAQ2_9GAMM|nr:2'-5' RNA ligase family protein [Marinobacterium weihaiense]MBV0933372.1 2'-5' RNA ligase family protein [Marinobacterium weihaiense]
MPLPTHTLTVSLDDCPQWHRGIRHYAVWCLPIEDPQWQAFIEQAQARLAPWLHPGYARQPHITVQAAGLVDKKHYAAGMRCAQIQSLELYSLSPMLLTAASLSTFATAPWLGIEDVYNRLQSLRQVLQQNCPDDSPPARYQPHVTLGFYRRTCRVDEVMARLAPLQAQARALPPLRIERLQLCYYDTHETQGPLTVKERIELNSQNHPQDRPGEADHEDPLAAIRQMRQNQLRVCALKQQAELEQLVAGAGHREADADAAD